MYEHLAEKCLEEKTVFKGKILEVNHDTVELPDKSRAFREVVYHCGGVAIAALTDDNCLMFVRQYSYPYREVLLEIPAGKLDAGEEPLAAAKRELLEEVGAIGEDYRYMGVMYPSPGCYRERLHLYFCRVREFGSSNPDEDEFLETEKIPLDQAVQMCLDNEIADAKTQLLILKIAAILEWEKTEKERKTERE